eukprot:gb/GEZN01005347.1/.p1 GENE.gb/GEZN01005347.1/~~gb/GEZN01005347.1/.p1  ORF type:complete len:486 (+),score=68.15 gb/GEZN01005347.1/:52-1509(+)
MSSKRNASEAAETSSKKQKTETASKQTLGGFKVVTGVFADSGSGLNYLHGFGAELQSEAIPGTVPIGRNAPKKVAFGLVAEQLSGTSFTTPRVHNQRTWLYRIKPTASHAPFKPYSAPAHKWKGEIVNDDSKMQAMPNRYRWKPYPLPPPSEKIDFIEGWSTVGGAGGVASKSGFAVHVYACNSDMGDKAFVNSDGDLLVVPQLGRLLVQTEFGLLEVPPGFICVIQRGMALRVFLPDKQPCRGYLLEVYCSHFRLPDLGPIGANGLANARDFQHPTAKYEDRKCKFTVVQKFLGSLFTAEHTRSVFDVVGWHGNYLPYRYDLDRFCAVNSVTYDHMDPSIFTVLTAPTNELGVACADFVIFPPRWAVQEDTFRPPYYHRNCMTEYMGNIRGQYDAKPSGFLPGGGSLHSMMAGHGPSKEVYDKASTTPDAALKMPDAMAFMFESTYFMKLTPWALQEELLDVDYYKDWEGVAEGDFSPPAKDKL